MIIKTAICKLFSVINLALLRSNLEPLPRNELLYIFKCLHKIVQLIQLHSFLMRAMIDSTRFLSLSERPMKCRRQYLIRKEGHRRQKEYSYTNSLCGQREFCKAEYIKRDNRIVSDLSIISLFYMRKYSADLSRSIGRRLRHSFASFCGGYFNVCETYLFNSFGYWFVAAAAIIINTLISYAFNSCKTVNDNTKFCRRIKCDLKCLYNRLNVPAFSNLHQEYTLHLSVPKR
jgi:hypothetical protein